MRRYTEKEPKIFDFTPKDTTELERRVLSDAVAFPEQLGDTIQVVTTDFFTDESRRAIWEKIVSHYNSGEQVSITTIGQVVDPVAFRDEVIPYYAEGVVSDVPFNAQALRNGAAERRLFYAIADLLDKTKDPSISEADILSLLEGFNRAVEGSGPLQGEKRLADALKDLRADVVKTQKAIEQGRNIRVTTGFVGMNEILNGGFKSGQLVILAARPSVGKTALMLQMAKAAARAGNPVQVFSLEMTCGELAERLLYSTGDVHPYQVNHGEVEWRTYYRAEGELIPLPLYINDFSRSLDDIISRLTQSVKKDRCKVAFIDYLGLMQDSLNFGNAKLYQVIARITGTLKAVAKRLEIPIVLLCQLNRDAARDGRAPELFDLRDSGSIEQDADVVIMLENKLATEQRIVAWLRKNRAGKKEVGFVLKPNETYSSFEEGGVLLPGGAVEPPKALEDIPEYKPLEEPGEDDEFLPF